MFFGALLVQGTLLTAARQGVYAPLLAAHGPQTTRLPMHAVLQYHNANMKGLKHASYLRLMTLKDVFWALEPVLQAGDSGR